MIFQAKENFASLRPCDTPDMDGVRNVAEV